LRYRFRAYIEEPPNMSQTSMTFAFVMDPIEGIDIRTDTTFLLMLEAQRRGHRVLYLEPSDLCIEAGRLAADVHPATLQRRAGAHFKLGPRRRLVLDDAVDVVFQRKDPPVDAAYVTTTQLLTLCQQALVLNRPSGILAANEKLYALHFPELMPQTVVTKQIDELRAFMEKLGGEMIVKPLAGKGGEGIFHLQTGDRNLSAILEQATRFGSEWVMAQEYLPEIREGDKRIILVNGEPIGAVLRVPQPGETRANLHVGGRAKRTKLDASDLRIVETIAPKLREDGLFFVGIDVIGGQLTEVNVTSPTGIQEINALEGGTREARVIEAVEKCIRD